MYLVGRSVGRAVATGRDERGDKGEGRGEVTALAVACTDQTDAQIEIQREIDGERERAGDVAQMRPECKRTTTTAKLNNRLSLGRFHIRFIR